MITSTLHGATVPGWSMITSDEQTPKRQKGHSIRSSVENAMKACSETFAKTLRMSKRPSVERFDLLLAVLRDMQRADILRHFVLVGSWCLIFYRQIYDNPVEIPAVRTLDADILIPKRIPKAKQVSIPHIMEKNEYSLQIGSDISIVK